MMFGYQLVELGKETTVEDLRNKIYFGNKIKKFRKQRGYSRQLLADVAGVDVKIVYQIEMAEEVSNPDEFKKLMSLVKA